MKQNKLILIITALGIVIVIVIVIIIAIINDFYLKFTNNLSDVSNYIINKYIYFTWNKIIMLVAMIVQLYIPENISTCISPILVHSLNRYPILYILVQLHFSYHFPEIFQQNLKFHIIVLFFLFHINNKQNDAFFFFFSFLLLKSNLFS